MVKLEVQVCLRFTTASACDLGVIILPVSTHTFSLWLERLRFQLHGRFQGLSIACVCACSIALHAQSLQSCPTLTPWTVAHQTPLFMGFSWTENWSGLPFPSPGDLPNPGIELGSHTFQAGSLPAEPQGKSKNTGVGGLSLLQWIFPTQELNWGLLHCRRILYQLSYQGKQPYSNKN